MMTKEFKSEVIARFAKSDNDTGSTAVQIALVTEHIYHISNHLQKFRKDNHSRLGLIKLVGKKNRLCRYLKKTDPARYNEVMAMLKRKK